MSQRRLNIALTRRLPDVIMEHLSAAFDLRCPSYDRPMQRDELIDAMAQADVLVPNLTDPLDRQILALAGPGLKLIANYGSGVDHIDVDYARERGIMVSNTPGVVTEDTADLVLALILCVTRGLPQGYASMAAGEWQGWSPSAFLGARLAGKKLGILGMGRIGQAVARRARAFGLEIHYHNRHRLAAGIEQPLGARYWESLDQMLARIDILSVNCPHTPATYHLINERRLKLMKRSAVVINASRGQVIDQNALTRALRSQEIAGAGLDVYERGNEINPRLRELPNAVLLPHMGSATVEGRVEMGQRVLRNINAFAAGQLPPDLILPDFSGV